MSDSKSTEERKKVIVGSLEWKIYKLFAPYPRVHKAHVCEHKGNCLTAEQATDYVMQLLDQELAKHVEEADRRTLETLAAILSGSGKTVTGNQPQDEKRTIEIALSYIRNKLEVKQPQACDCIYNDGACKEHEDKEEV